MSKFLLKAGVVAAVSVIFVQFNAIRQIRDNVAEIALTSTAIYEYTTTQAKMNIGLYRDIDGYYYNGHKITDEEAAQIQEKYPNVNYSNTLTEAMRRGNTIK